MDEVCMFCQALHWLDERLSNSSMIRPKFGTCCYQGKVKPSYLRPIPPELHHLLTSQGPIEKAFRKLIRQYNQVLAFTSVGRQVDDTLNRSGRAPYSFRLHGELIHRAGSLLPSLGQAPAWAQLYIYDLATALNHRLANRINSALDRVTLQTLQDMLYRAHPAVQIYKHAFQIT